MISLPRLATTERKKKQDKVARGSSLYHCLHPQKPEVWKSHPSYETRGHKSLVAAFVLFDQLQEKGAAPAHRHATIKQLMSRDPESCNLPPRVLLSYSTVPEFPSQVPSVPLEAEIQN
jgi:hypothetical protein